MDVSLSVDPGRMDVDFVWRMLRETYWSPRVRRDVVVRAIGNSMVVGAFDALTGTQVAFARAVTDRATFAWLCDVVVDERYRGRGIARRMVRRLMEDPEVKTLRRWCLATMDAHGVYAPLGFAPVTPGRFMEHKLPREVWSEP